MMLIYAKRSNILFLRFFLFHRICENNKILPSQFYETLNLILTRVGTLNEFKKQQN